MNEPRRLGAHDRMGGESAESGADLLAAWRAARTAPDYPEEAARQAASAAHADVEDRVMDWIEGVAAETWDDLRLSVLTT